MTVIEFRLYLRALINPSGLDDKRNTQKAFAQKHGIGEAVLSDVLNGRRDPSTRFLEKLNMEWVIQHKPLEDAHVPPKNTPLSA